MERNYGLGINKKDGYGKTPLHHTVTGGCLAIVEDILEKGGSLKERDGNDKNCLVLSCESKWGYNSGIMNALIEAPEKYTTEDWYIEEKFEAYWAAVNNYNKGALER
ncbi:MAG: hypothetical protein M1834_008971 [Cirrosporium novae-zelandiae]|nr:MAG: hypothetical protein M1834_008971 [Cirrosporium novae-zelandiae]